MDDAPGRTHAPVGAEASRDKYGHLYKSARWTKVSEMQRSRFPVCEMKCGRLADLADHYIPAVVYIELCRASKKFFIAEGAFFDISNLQSLCIGCHQEKTVEDERKIASGAQWTELGRPPKKWTF